MTALVDRIVLMEHPFMHNQYVIAKVVAQTTKTVQVQYWKARHSDWDEELNRRHANSVNRVLCPDLTPSAQQLNQLSARLQSAVAERDQRHKLADAAYFKTIKELEIK